MRHTLGGRGRQENMNTLQNVPLLREDLREKYKFNEQTNL